MVSITFAAKSSQLIQIPKEQERRRLMLGSAKMLDQIKEALRENGSGMRVCYQPMKELWSLDQPAIFFEALVRLDSLGKLVPASAFIGAVLNDVETSLALDDFVLRSVAAQIKRHENYRYAVNVTAASLASPDFDDKIRRLFGDTAKDQLVIELIEDQPLNADAVATTRRMRKLTSLYLDDVGTGFSNAEAIVSLSVDGLKIDGSYVTRMLTSPPHKAIIEAVFVICLALRMTCICEHVESPALIEALKSLAGNYRLLDLYLQGYAVGRPELHR
jgi:EAL domain-containing protein (putative c-di-GMP-specific phosphodiesterase class I)